MNRFMNETPPQARTTQISEGKVRQAESPIAHSQRTARELKYFIYVDEPDDANDNDEVHPDLKPAKKLKYRPAGSTSKKCPKKERNEK